jgi:predicted lipoprotein with Yx(FWY)xxD motif
MPRLRTFTIGLAATTMMSGALAIGGVGISAGASATHRAPHAMPAAGGVTVKTHHKGLGTYLVGSNGHALYRFDKDKLGSKSHCYKDCAKDWPPLITTGKPNAAGKAKASLLGTTKRKNGDRQVTYNGHPLYFFSEDKKAGQTHGEGITEFGAEWNVVNKNGKEIHTHS